MKQGRFRQTDDIKMNEISGFPPREGNVGQTPVGGAELTSTRRLDLPWGEDTLTKTLKMFICSLWKNVHRGASTTCYAPFHPGLRGVSGKYYADCNELEPSDLAKDVKLDKKLWDFSSKMVDGSVSL
ncbi:hypothetical protein SAY87_008482 [Trapa incisa]|uniref:Uncharacterized protein n=1 Tax=Trapa incisa TaxID=236973 RepID=A0AAN7KNW0_9MYRT|nr:hypothetical protein SAY87_008482 [Trapa incisa]